MIMRHLFEHFVLCACSHVDSNVSLNNFLLTGTLFFSSEITEINVRRCWLAMPLDAGMLYNRYPVNKELMTITFLVIQKLLTGTIQVNKKLLTGAVLVNKKLFTGTVPVNNFFLILTVLVHIFLIRLNLCICDMDLL